MENVMSHEEFHSLLDGIQVEKMEFKANLSIGEKSGVDEALAKLKIYWKPIKVLLKLAKIPAPPKIAKGIEEFIRIVDRLTGGATGEEQSELLEKFAVVWGIIKPILEAFKGSVSPKAEAVINEVIKIGDLLAKS